MHGRFMREIELLHLLAAARRSSASGLVTRGTHVHVVGGARSAPSPHCCGPSDSAFRVIGRDHELACYNISMRGELLLRSLCGYMVEGCEPWIAYEE